MNDCLRNLWPCRTQPPGKPKSYVLQPTCPGTPFTRSEATGARFRQSWNGLDTSQDDTVVTNREGCLAHALEMMSSHDNSLWPLVSVLLFCIVLFGYRAAVENHSAKRQQTSLGTIGECEERGRGHDNYCHYTFQVGDEQYAGVGIAEPGTEFGQTAIVYYDTQNPEVSALEDFSAQSRKNMRSVYFLLLTLAASVAFILWNRASPARVTESSCDSVSEK
jgi:hypothetical protein